MPPHPDAIEAARITGHQRFLDLCDPDHADYNEHYLSVVGQIARPQSTTTETVSPGFFAKATSFASHIVSVMAGAKQLNDEDYEARLAICQKPCEFFDEGTCKSCGCKLMSEIPMLAKARWADQQCPKGYWPTLDPSQERPS